MKDNFDLKKFLTENKVFEEFNPYTSESYSADEKDDADHIEDLEADITDDKAAAIRKKVREAIIAELSLDEAKKDKADDDVEDVEDVEVEDTEEFEAEPDMEQPQDLDGGEKEIMDSLENALEFAKQKGDEKLIDQIGNTITFFTRQYIVK
jgi:hypothetical protein